MGLHFMYESRRPLPPPMRKDWLVIFDNPVTGEKNYSCEYATEADAKIEASKLLADGIEASTRRSKPSDSLIGSMPSLQIVTMQSRTRRSSWGCKPRRLTKSCGITTSNPTRRNDMNSDYLFECLAAGEWRCMIATCREWYAANCPRYPRDEVEIKAGGWVGTMMITRQQNKEFALLPESDPMFKTPAKSEEELRKRIESHFNDPKWSERNIYVRWCNARDNPKTAEEHVGEIVARLAKRAA